MNPCLWEEHGEIPRRGQSPVAGLASELESCPHGILGRPAPDSSAVLPDVHADRHAVSIGQLQRLGRDLFALGRIALLMQELEIPAAVRSAVNPRDDVIDRSAVRRIRQVVPAPRAAPALRLHQFGHECQAVRCPRHNLVVVLAITSAGAKRPAAQPLPGRHRQPAHTAPARLGRHEVKLTGRSDITAVADGEQAGPRGGPRADRHRCQNCFNSTSHLASPPLIRVTFSRRRSYFSRLAAGSPLAGRCRWGRAGVAARPSPVRTPGAGLRQAAGQRCPRCRRRPRCRSAARRSRPAGPG
jgi:hypothetical protein